MSNTDQLLAQIERARGDIVPIWLDYGEARELAQAIFEGAEEQGLVTLDLMPNGFMVSTIPEGQATRRIP